MKHIGQISLLAVVMFSLNGCGWLWGSEKSYFRDRSGDYLQAQTVEPMRLPDDIQSKPLDPLLPIPAHIPDVRNRNASEVPRPQPLAIITQLEGDYFIQQSGQLSWIVAQRIPAQVWPLAQAYFEQQGFMIAEEKPHLGQFDTQWQDAAQLQTQLSHALALPQNEQIRYQVRIEPGVQRNTSEIFIDSATRSWTADAAWSATPLTTAQADVVLQQLQEFLQHASEKGDSYSLLASRNYDAPRRVVLVDLGNGSQALRLDANFDRAWSGVGRALEGAALYVDDIDRSQGVYFVDPERTQFSKKPGFFKRLFTSRKSEARSRKEQLYRLKLTPIAHQVFVSLEKDADTLADPVVTKRVLETIQAQLN